MSGCNCRNAAEARLLMGAMGIVGGGAGGGGAPGVHQRVSGRSRNAGAHGGDNGEQTQGVGPSNWWAHLAAVMPQHLRALRWRAWGRRGAGPWSRRCCWPVAHGSRAWVQVKHAACRGRGP